jgi:hypothetical protein
VPDGVISLAQNTFRYHHPEGLEALLKPVSQVRILPGAPCRGHPLFCTGKVQWRRREHERGAVVLPQPCSELFEVPQFAERHTDLEQTMLVQRQQSRRGQPGFRPRARPARRCGFLSRDVTAWRAASGWTGFELLRSRAEASSGVTSSLVSPQARDSYLRP